ncbi:uncharacterized protein BJX67DRAFT_389145 [Aspergillus lucknowensis]|uniref:DUF7587 domain-containing protein n=1 Tax=Aspergillus lucknowensis TaxID=176173 RepID=A0ABR4M4W2_9EURO
MEALSQLMTRNSLGDVSRKPEQLLFRPKTNSGLAEGALDNIPPHLFRVVSPRSDGQTNAVWVHSESAYREKASSLEDIFYHLDSKKGKNIARTLNHHLRWWGKRDGVEDNFVSRASSLVFAIQYIYYRHSSKRDGSSLDEIKLYIIDTAKFPRGTFIRDLDLIDAFYNLDDSFGLNLADLRSLRNERGYYFGEYLSQGSLNIEGKHQVILAKAIIDNSRLRRLQPIFAELRTDSTKVEKPAWGRENIEPDWKFPLAVYFAAFIGSESRTEDHGTANDNVFFAYFRSQYSGERREWFENSRLDAVTAERMPEVKRAMNIFRELHKDFQLRQALDLVATAETKIRLLHTRNVFSEHGSAFTVADSNDVLARAGQTILNYASRSHWLSQGANCRILHSGDQPEQTAGWTPDDDPAPLHCCAITVRRK